MDAETFIGLIEERLDESSRQADRHRELMHKFEGANAALLELKLAVLASEEDTSGDHA